VKFGIMFANVGPFSRPDDAAELGRIAEECGIESLWTVEHVVVPAGYASEYPYSKTGRMPGGEDAPIPDPLIWLTWVAAHTSTIRLATGIVILPQRNPLVFAKEVATLDALSGGRVTLGVGVGWLQEEFDAIGVPFDERGSRTDDHIEALRALWEGGPVEFDGRFTKFAPLSSYPQPAQGTGVPIVIGGHSTAAARRAGRLGDGFFPAKGSLSELLPVMREAAVEAGRDPDAIEITRGGAPDLDSVKRLVDEGVGRVVFPPLAYDRDGLREALSRLHDAVISKT
jgi:probable F420-dependent oxidoreductase